MNENSRNNILNSKEDKLKIIKKVNEIMKYNEEETNELEYDLAIQYDNRSFCQYYCSLLKIKQNFSFTFIYKDYYNSKIIKIDLFLINIIIYCSINALFFNDDIIHNIYIKKGLFDIEYQFPQIIYSFIISLVLNLLLKYFALSSGNILKLKKNKSKNDIQKRENDLINKIRTKSILFSIFSFIVLFFCWYYLAVFCAVYNNTQYHLIKSISISFGLSLIYPFFIYLLPGIFRITALSNKNKKRKCLYNFSKLLQKI